MRIGGGEGGVDRRCGYEVWIGGADMARLPATTHPMHCIIKLPATTHPIHDQATCGDAWYHHFENGATLADLG